jgi:hypothetical protein
MPRNADGLETVGGRYRFFGRRVKRGPLLALRGAREDGNDLPAGGWPFRFALWMSLVAAAAGGAAPSYGWLPPSPPIDQMR